MGKVIALAFIAHQMKPGPESELLEQVGVWHYWPAAEKVTFKNEDIQRLECVETNRLASKISVQWTLSSENLSTSSLLTFNCDKKQTGSRKLQTALKSPDDDDGKDEQEVATSLAAAKEISVDVAVVALLSDLDLVLTKIVLSWRLACRVASDAPLHFTDIPLHCRAAAIRNWRRSGLVLRQK